MGTAECLISPRGRDDGVHELSSLGAIYFVVHILILVLVFVFVLVLVLIHLPSQPYTSSPLSSSSQPSMPSLARLKYILLRILLCGEPAGTHYRNGPYHGVPKLVDVESEKDVPPVPQQHGESAPHVTSRNSNRGERPLPPRTHSLIVIRPVAEAGEFRRAVCN